MDERPIEGVIFDLDGTLFDHHGSAETGLCAWLAQLGVPTRDELVAAWFEAEARHMVSWQKGEISWAEQRRRRLRDFLPQIGGSFLPGIRCGTGTDRQLDETFKQYLACYQAVWRTFEDVVPVLNWLNRNNFRVGVLTNGETAQQEAKLAAIGLAGRVGPVLTSMDLGMPKPDPGSYLEGCHRLGLPAHAVLHVGDTYDLDVVGPHAAGLHAVHLDRSQPNPSAPHQHQHQHQHHKDSPNGRPDPIHSLNALPGLLGHSAPACSATLHDLLGHSARPGRPRTEPRPPAEPVVPPGPQPTG